MRKVFVDKKVSLFKEAFPNCKESKKGTSYHITIGPIKKKREVYMGAMSVTKGTLNEIGTIRTWEKPDGDILLITKKGRFMLKTINEKKFKNVTLKSIRLMCLGANIGRDRWSDNLSPEQIKAVVQIFFTGRKYEWMINYPCLWLFRYFQSFKSLGDAKKYLGYGFLSDDEFISLYRDETSKVAELLFHASPHGHQARVNTVSYVKGATSGQLMMYKDYLTMCISNGVEPEFYAGKNKIKELHDTLVDIQNLKATASRKSNRIYYTGKLIDDLNESGLDYMILDSGLALAMEGKKQKHCIGSYDRTLYNKQELFISVVDENDPDNRYDAQIIIAPMRELFRNVGDIRIKQFLGYRNNAAPKELLNKLSSIVTKSKCHINAYDDPEKVEQINYKSATEVFQEMFKNEHDAVTRKIKFTNSEQTIGKILEKSLEKETTTITNPMLNNSLLNNDDIWAMI